MTDNTQLAVSAVNQPSPWTDAEKLIIKAQFFPEGTTVDEMKYCMSVAESLGLNPILKQIWFVPRRSKNSDGQWCDKVEPMAGRDSFLTLAHRSGQFSGIKSWVKIKDGPTLVNGEWEMKKDLYGIAEVKRKDTDEVFRAEVKYSEYVQRTKEGTPTKFWNDKPETMIKKVADSQVLRKAFNISGLYDESELGRPIKNVDVSIQNDTKKLPPREQAAFDVAKELLLACEDIEALSGVMKNADREEIGYLWSKLDQEYLMCVEDMQNTIGDSIKTDESNPIKNADPAKVGDLDLDTEGFPCQK